MKKESRILVTGDWHVPHVSEKVFIKFLERVREINPTETILNGDILDSGSLSKFAKLPKTPSLMDEVILAKKYLARLREVTDSPITFLTGNHERRLTLRIMETMPGLYGAVPLDNLLGLKSLEIGFQHIEKPDNYVRRGNWLLGHFHSARVGAGNTALWLMKKYGMNICQGHVHRLAVTALRQYGRTLMGAESCSLCSLDPEFMDYPDWVNGFIVIKNGFPVPSFL